MSVLISSHAALVLVALVAADPRAYVGPEGVPARPEPGSWPASAGAPPGQGASAGAASKAAVPQDRSSVPGDSKPVAQDMPVEAVPEEPVADATTTVPGGEAVGLAREVRYIEVTTSLLGRSTRLDVHRHAGGRAIVSTKKAIEDRKSVV